LVLRSSQQKRDIARVRLLWRELNEHEIEDKREESVAQYKLIILRAWEEYSKNKSTNLLRVIMDAQEKIDGIEGNRKPEEVLVGKLPDIEEVRKKRWEQVQGELTQALGGLDGNGSNTDKHPLKKIDPHDKSDILASIERVMNDTGWGSVTVVIKNGSIYEITQTTTRKPRTERQTE